jgi:hypothetical protein
MPILNLNRTIEDIVNEHGLSMSFVIKRRIYSQGFMLNCESIIKSMNDKEVDFLFNQIMLDNIAQLAYNEEPIALK